MDETATKIAKLPTWAREHIKRLEGLPAALADEATRLRKECARLQVQRDHLRDQVEAMTEMFRCAGVGGSDVAKKIVEILDGYEILPQKKAERSDN